MNKNISLKRKILIPMLIIIVVTPILTLVAFNLTMKRYTRSVAVDSLKNVLAVSKDREALLERISDKKNNLMGNISLAVRINRYNNDIIYALLDTNFDKYDNKRVKNTVSDELMGYLKPTLLRMNESKIKIANFNNIRYAFTYLKVGTGAPNVLLVSSTDFADPFIKLVNIIIICITIITIAVGLFLTYRINKGVIKPIKALCAYTQQIGEGNFIDVPINNSFAEIHELSLRMSDMSRQLKLSTDNQNSLMQNISHEIRTPLMSIQSYAEGIKEGIFKDVNYATTIIRDECARLNSLVNQLLLLSKIENQNYEIDVEEIDLSNTLLEYLQSLNSIAVKHNIVLNLVTNEKNIFIKANDTLLTQVVYNIVSNGVRYVKSKVDVALTKDPNNAILTIADDGNGFNKKDLQHVFDRFYKGAKGKFGLGLTIAKSAVEFMGGKISVENENTGAKFTIVIPLAD